MYVYLHIITNTIPKKEVQPIDICRRYLCGCFLLLLLFIIYNFIIFAYYAYIVSMYSTSRLSAYIRVGIFLGANIGRYSSMLWFRNIWLVVTIIGHNKTILLRVVIELKRKMIPSRFPIFILLRYNNIMLLQKVPQYIITIHIDGAYTYIILLCSLLLRV